MNNRYVAFDVETPNHENNRICSIGITVIEDCEIIQKLYYTINPGTYFDRFNMLLTGITPYTVSASPKFPEVWEQIGYLFTSAVCVAHNAPFDMSVLSACLRDYRLPHPRCLDYICTYRCGRRAVPTLYNHKLNTLCEYFDIDLLHHNAASDSEACARLLLKYIQCGVDVNKFIKSYDVLYGQTLKK